MGKYKVYFIKAEVSRGDGSTGIADLSISEGLYRSSVEDVQATGG